MYSFGNAFNQPFPKFMNQSQKRLSTDMLIRLFDFASFLIGNAYIKFERFLNSALIETNISFTSIDVQQHSYLQDYKQE